MPRRFRVQRVYRLHSSHSQEPLRIAMVLSGAVALGSFEAGVVAELLRAVQAGAPITMDIVVGSSAGALVGAMTAKALVTGMQPEPALQQWTEFTLEELTSIYESAEEARKRGHPLDRGLLSSEAVRRILHQFLASTPPDRSFQPAFPAPRVSLIMALTNLDGLPGASDDEKDHRFSEAVTFRFSPPYPNRLERCLYPCEAWSRVVEVVRASSAYPGAFDPDTIRWADRVQVPDLVEEAWENDTLLERLHQLDPTIQPKMRYSDGGVQDDRPMERTIAALPSVTGDAGQSGDETLVYDPRRCIVFIEPDPSTTSIDALKAGTSQTWLATLGRSLRLFTLGASPRTSARRLMAANKRQERLFQFLADLARRMAEEGRAPSGEEAAAEFQRLNPGLEVVRRVGITSGGMEEPPGLIDPGRFKQAIWAFYQWLQEDLRFRSDMDWLDSLPTGRLKESHSSIRNVLLDLREAYVALEGVDPLQPHAYQSVLEDVHANLAESLGLTQPWITMQQITPDDPRQSLKGVGIAHFGGFFSKEFLRHDYQVGRYYAYLWLREVVPGFVPPEAPPQPPDTEDELNLRLLWENRGPLWRMFGRLTGVLLEALGFRYDTEGQWMARLLGWSLLLSMFHGLLLLIGGWLGWITFPPGLNRLRLWLLLGSSLFPLAFGLCMGLALRVSIVRAIWRRSDRS